MNNNRFNKALGCFIIASFFGLLALALWLMHVDTVIGGCLGLLLTAILVFIMGWRIAEDIKEERNSE